MVTKTQVKSIKNDIRWSKELLSRLRIETDKKYPHYSYANEKLTKLENIFLSFFYKFLVPGIIFNTQ